MSRSTISTFQLFEAFPDQETASPTFANLSRKIEVEVAGTLI